MEPIKIAIVKENDAQDPGAEKAPKIAQSDTQAVPVKKQQEHQQRNRCDNCPQ